MRKLLLTAIALALAAPALAAQQDIAQISAVTASREALRTAINAQLSAVQANFDEVYAVIDAGPVYVNASAPADQKVVWIDTDQSNAIKVYVGGAWTVVGSGSEGSYTLPTAAADTLGGIKVGSRLTITDGVLSADVQAGGESTTVGDGTTGPYLDGTVDGGTLIKLSAPSGGNGTWTSLQGGNPTANRNWRLPIDAPPAAGTTRLINVDENTQMGLVDPATFLTPTGSADSLTITDAGTYFTTDTVAAALQELGSFNASLPALTIQTSSITTGATNILGSDYGLIADTDGDGLPNKIDVGDGLVKVASNVTAVATAGTDYQAAGTNKVTTASKATNYTIGTDSAAEAYGGTVYVTGAATITAPAVAVGMSFSVVTIGAIAVSLDVNASDRMILDGTALADGDKATNTSTAGDTIYCQYESADGWFCWSGTMHATTKHWTDGN